MYLILTSTQRSFVLV